MTTNRVLILALACALTGGATATAEPRLNGVSTTQIHDLSAATKKKKARRAQPQQQIACTFFGCQPVPAGCYQRQGYDFWGNPTGFDVIICPRR